MSGFAEVGIGRDGGARLPSRHVPDDLQGSFVECVRSASAHDAAVLDLSVGIDCELTYGFGLSPRSAAGFRVVNHSLFADKLHACLHAAGVFGRFFGIDKRLAFPFLCGLLEFLQGVVSLRPERNVGVV